MISAQSIKEFVTSLGADLCGVSPIDRFSKAPEGFHPTDIYDACKSVIVFARRLPSKSLSVSNCVPYTFVNSVMTQEVDRLTLEIALRLEGLGLGSVPVPSDDPYEHWEPNRSYGRAILSLRHAGYLAGLGILGKNTLLINKDYGNMIQIGAVLVDAELDGDPIAIYEACLSGCQLCIDSCPEKALDGESVNQQLCRPRSNFRTEKGYILKKCSLCRSICPTALGMKQQSIDGPLS